MVTATQIRDALKLLSITAKVKTKKDALLAIKDFCDKEIEIIDQHHLMLVIHKIEKSHNKDIRLLAEAIRHSKFKEKPKTDKLAYKIADVCRKIGSVYLFQHFSHKDADLVKEIHKIFDITSYVFVHTHFDECSNGFFFRRS